MNIGVKTGVAVVVGVAAPMSIGSNASGALQAAAELNPSVVSGGYHYATTLRNTGTTNIQSFWFAWIPGLNFLPALPKNITQPTGWLAIVTGSGTSSDGYGIEWYTNNPSFAIAPGASSSAFSFDAAITPAVMSGPSPINSVYKSTRSFVYTGTPLSGPGYQFDATVVPGSSGLAAFAGAAMLAGRRRRR